MLSRAQQILLKRAQREAGLPDDEYRDVIESVSGCRSSRDRDWTDRALDKALSFMESIYWRKVDGHQLQPGGSRTAIFRKRGFWAARNTNTETSRDRFIGHNRRQDVERLEADLATLGFSSAYCSAIRKRVCDGRTDEAANHLYAAALVRTLKAKAAQAPRPEDPF